VRSGPIAELTTKKSKRGKMKDTRIPKYLFGHKVIGYRDNYTLEQIRKDRQDIKDFKQSINKGQHNGKSSTTLSAG